MDIIYAAEKRSIAELLGHHVHRAIGPEEINVAENPGETGSFFIGWGTRRYVLSPAGEIATDGRGQMTHLRAPQARA